MKWLSALVSGLVFGVGLGIAGMTQPEKVRGFLDVTGDWDPSLALVMVGAIGVHAVALRLILRRNRPLFDATFDMPPVRRIDPRLVLGAALFGVGWGMAGYCPGPAIVNLATAGQHAIAFAAAMAAGMVLMNVMSPGKSVAATPTASPVAPTTEAP